MQAKIPIDQRRLAAFCRRNHIRRLSFVIFARRAGGDEGEKRITRSNPHG